MSAIAPETINPLDLPSMPLDWRRAFPECPGIYFALSKTGQILYIGRYTNISQRWISHHRYEQLQQIGEVRVAWLQVSDLSLLPAIEAALIEYFKPQLNWLKQPKVAAPKKKIGAPKGNKNGVAAWYKPLTHELTVQLAVRVSKSEASKIDAQLEPGQSRSEWLRDAIAQKLKSCRECKSGLAPLN